MKKNAQTALKSFFGRSTKSTKGDKSSNSLTSIQGGSPIADAAQKSPASLEQATTAADSLVSRLERCLPPSEVASDGKAEAKNEMASPQPSTELTDAINEFRNNYVQFSKANSEYILVDDELENILPDSATFADVREVAKIFEQNVTKTIRINEKKKLLTQSHWPMQVSRFLSKLYPIAKLSCSLMGAAAESANFAPLKGATSGLGIILQLLADESARSDDFILELRRIEDQAALLADNPQYHLALESTQRLLNEKSTDLLTAAIIFFNSALLYFSKGFFGNLSNTVINGADIYRTGKKQLRNAIRQYDQVMMHLTARAVAAMNIDQMKQHDAEFLDWLVGQPYWQVESQLSSFRQQRSDGTLDWARTMPEFQAWRLSDVVDGPERRITWIKGSLGLGKSVMAAYFIDLLKCQYRNAVVAYFFCRSDQPGLTNARDILRTLAYQCVGNNDAARKALENLKSKGFQVTPDLGIGFLFEKLLLDPLKSTQEIYIVLDGLDEADDATQDHTDPAGRPELHIFLACLARVPSIRLLCISRPNANIKAIIPNAFEKTISKSDNVDDIDSYVRTEVGKSVNLQTLFRQDPVQYFRNHGEGVFLWVKLVLQQLAKAKTASVFQKYLDGFSTSYDGTDKLETLYYTILSRITEDEKTWVKEIIRWLLIAKTPLSIGTLQSLAEWCLEDKIVAFHQFLDETCGSLLHFLPQAEGKDDIVELVHETFKSFIVNPHVCPLSFLIDKPEADCYAALQCLKCLTNHASAPNEVSEYSSSNWVAHLSVATTIQLRTSVLVALYDFIASDGTKFWIKRYCKSQRHDVGSVSPTSAGLPLQDIIRWLRDCTFHADEQTNAGNANSDLEIEHALKWQRDCLDNSSLLDETIGKAAVNSWLHEDLDECYAVIHCFILGLKYYWRRANRTRTNLEELNELTATKFRDLSAWADPTGPSVPIVHGNLGLAFFAVKEFDKCLQHLRVDNSICDIDEKLLPSVAFCLFAARDYDGIIEAFDSKRCGLSMHVFSAYKIKRAYNRAIDVFQAAHERDPLSLVNWLSLFYAHEARGDFDKIIDMSKSALTNNPIKGISGQYHLYAACRRKCDYNEAIHIYKARIDENPKDITAWHFLANSYEDKGDFDSAIDTLELGLLENPRDHQLSSDLVRTVIGKGEYAEAIKKLRRAIEKGQMVVGTVVKGLVRVYHQLNDLNGLIAELQPIAHKHRFDANILHYLCEAYIVAGEYDEAINLSKIAADNLELSHYLNRLFDDLCRACKAKGDRTTAIQVFESKVKSAKFDDTFPLPAILDLYDVNHDSIRAKKVFEAIVGSGGDNGGAWGWPGLLRFSARDGDFDAIVERMDRLVDDGQMDATCEVAEQLTNAYYARGEHDKAIAELTKVVHRLPLVPWPWDFLGQAYIRMGNYHEAIKVYESTIRRHPYDCSLYLRLANVYLSLSNYNRVIECYEVIRETFWDEPGMLTIYTNTTTHPSGMLIDERFRENLLWYPIYEAHKRQGDDHEAHLIYDSVVDKYQKALSNGHRSLWHTYVYGAQGPSVRIKELPEYALLCAVGEVYKAKRDSSSALATFQKARALLPSNSYLEKVIAELEKNLPENVGKRA